MQIDMQTCHIILNILNMPKDSQNICDELKSTMVCRVRPNQVALTFSQPPHFFLSKTFCCPHMSGNLLLLPSRYSVEPSRTMQNQRAASVVWASQDDIS